MAEREYYVLDRVEEGLAVLLPLRGGAGEGGPAGEHAADPSDTAAARRLSPEELPYGRMERTGAVRLPVQALCAWLPEGQARPADGMLFYRAADESWQADPAAAAERQAALRQRVRRLLGKSRERKK